MQRIKPAVNSIISRQQIAYISQKNIRRVIIILLNLMKHVKQEKKNVLILLMASERSSTPSTTTSSRTLSSALASQGHTNTHRRPYDRQDTPKTRGPTGGYYQPLYFYSYGGSSPNKDKVHKEPHMSHICKD